MNGISALLLMTVLQNSLGKWRYVLTGLPLAILFGLLCRTLGRLSAPFGEWFVFAAVCESAEDTPNGTTLCVRFADRNRVSHTVTFSSTSPAAKRYHAGDALQIGVHAKEFVAGLPNTIPPTTTGTPLICLRHEQRALCLRAMWRTAWHGLLACGVALAIFLLAMRICFPPRF